MLVLLRREGESIVCRTKTGERVVFAVLRMERNRVRVGVEAPLSITIDREEVDLRKHPELVNGNV